MMALDLAEEFLTGDSERTKGEVLDAIRFARGRGECPPWWAEVAFESRAIRREGREEFSAKGAA
jgi:hypothetical protein